MKLPPNGGLNLSVLDGWWCEGYNDKNGWVIGSEIRTATWSFRTMSIPPVFTNCSRIKSFPSIMRGRMAGCRSRGCN
jgi:hypothetical protein